MRCHTTPAWHDYTVHREIREGGGFFFFLWGGGEGRGGGQFFFFSCIISNICN